MKGPYIVHSPGVVLVADEVFVHNGVTEKYNDVTHVNSISISGVYMSLSR